MTAETLIQNFNLLAEAPGGSPKLRELILQLAVRGQLVPQDPKHEPARFMAEKMDAARMKRVNNGDIRDSEHILPIMESEVPYKIPVGWEWIRIGSAINMVNGKAFKPNEWSTSGLPIVRIQNLNNPDAPFNYCDFEVPQKLHIQNGDFLISWSGTPGTSFGAFIWQGGHAILNQHIFRCELYGDLFDKYLRLAVNAQLGEMIARAHGGVGLQHITKGKLEHMLVTLPPLAEQKRIVARVDELMKRCDVLETRQKERNTRRTSLTATCLHALTSDTDRQTPNNRNRDWERVCSHFPCLIETPEAVAELRKTIRQFAILGRLSSGICNGADASSLLTRLREQGAQNRQKEGKRDTGNCTEAHARKTLPELPKNWVWCRFGELVVEGPQNGFSPPKSDATSGIKVLTLSATTKGVFNPSYFKYIDEDAEGVRKYWLREGDLLFQRGNTPEYVGVSAVYHGITGEFIYPDLMIRVRVSPLLDLDYVHNALLSPQLRQWLREEASGTSNTMVKISQPDICALPFPVPPFAEQKNIVAKVNELMALCDALEAKLTQSRNDADIFANAVVHQICNDGSRSKEATT